MCNEAITMVVKMTVDMEIKFLTEVADLALNVTMIAVNVSTHSRLLV